MFADPITINYNAVAQTFNRIFSPAGGPTTYQTSDAGLTLEISHQRAKKRERHLFKITKRLISADPLNPATNVENKSHVYLVLDNPEVGFDDADLGYLIVMVTDYLGGSTARNKFIQNQS